MMETDSNFNKIGSELRQIEDHIRQLEELLSPLRDVARAAMHLAARGYEAPNVLWRQRTFDALAALPTWALEEES